ncbi:MAG: DsrE/DsrF/DrsH-like family protein [Dehalococcoidia bacterium]|nr:MAG: DsrE/DsrF/DrsH-like family protein [Dehalococcoidia bacterium]
MEQKTEEKKKKTTLVVISGDFDKLFAAFTIAAGAAAVNMDVTMFFTFWGMRALKKNVRTGKSLFGRMIGFIEGGDINKANPSKYGFLGLGRWMFKKMMKSKNVAGLDELRQLAIDLGVKMYNCQTSMEVMEITKEDLIDEAGETVGVGFMVEQSQQSDFTYFI